MRPVPLATLLAVATALAAAGPAGAAGITVPACSASLPGQPTVAVQGSGFAPGAAVRLSAGDQPLGTLFADGTGAVGGAVLAPALTALRRNIATFGLLADDGEGNTATADLRVTRVTAVLPRRARPRSRVRYRVFGFTPGRRVYLHVRRGGRTRGSYRIGRAAGPCGVTSRRLRYMPLRRFGSGTYEYWFQLSRRFDAAEPSVRLRIALTRRVAGR